jgi:hypothetical protein
MTTFIYDSASLSVKDRLTVSSLLGLFRSRLNANWVSAGERNNPVHLLLLDVDQAEGLKSWEESSPAKARIAITADDRSRRQPLITRPIRAFGPNGVIVLFNSIAQSLSSPAHENRPERREEAARIRPIERREEPARIRMTGRLELPTPTVRTIRPQTPATSRPETPRSSVPPPLPSPIPDVPVRVAVRWGPPEPVILPKLFQMPGARIHWLNRTEAHQETLEIPAPPPAPSIAPVVPEPEVIQQKFFSAPEADTASPLVNMPQAHRPTEIHAPAAPLINLVTFEAHSPAQPARVQPADVPVMRPAPPQWRSPEPEAVKALIDFRSLQDFQLPPEPEPAPEIIPDPVDAPKEVSEDETLEAEFASIEADLESLSNALIETAESEGPTEADADLDWWGTSNLEADNIDAPLPTPAEGSQLIEALKAVKTSGHPSILEIAGLPVVCVIPARNIYFTTAPSARIESAITARTEVTWRACASEADARQLSGTEQSRQASLEQLFWTASLLSPPADPGSLADRAVRLRRWPPITESRGRSKFIRYATMISGAQATPRELAEITGDSLDEIVCFVNACSLMNLVETSGQQKGPSLVPPTRTGGAGILRDMIEQLTPPKI